MYRFSEKGHNKKDIAMLSKMFLSPITLKQSAGVTTKMRNL
jgi:hypothetical protein